MGSCELVRKHRVDDRLDIRWVWVPSAVVHLCLSDEVVRCMARLKYIQSSAHIAFRQLQQRFLSIVRQFYAA